MRRNNRSISSNIHTNTVGMGSSSHSLIQIVDNIAHRSVSEIIIPSRVGLIVESDRLFFQRRDRCQRDLFDFSHVHDLLDRARYSDAILPDCAELI
jgi:hypothetical protein